MKKIIQIARLELSLLFYSPIAWLLIMVFFVQMTLSFTGSIAYAQHLLEFYPKLSSLTTKLFTGPMGLANRPLPIFFTILESLYLYIPLLTMGVFSRETSSGSIKLLYSSPVKLSQIVYGKFAALLIYSLVIIGIMGLFTILGALFIDHFDYPHVLVAMLAAYLLLIAYSAIGIFMSSLTNYQVVAAISTFGVLAFLNYIGHIGQAFDYIRDITYSLSMPSRAHRLVKGLLNTRDVIYYLSISGIFLAFTIARLELARRPRPILFQVRRYSLILIIGLSVTYITSRQRMIAYYDATDTKVNTITKASQEILQKMGEGPIEMTEYINGMHGSYFEGAPSRRIEEFERWEPYQRFNPNINLKWVYYYDSPRTLAGNPDKTLKEIFKVSAKAMDLDTADFISPEEIRKQIDLTAENERLVMHLKYNAKSTFLRTYEAGDFWPKEEHIIAALKRLIVTPPKVVFATDGYQRSMDKLGDRHYKMLLNDKLNSGSLINLGFDTDSIALEYDPIPADIAVLVIADPKVAFSPIILSKLQKYIAEGGNLMIAGEAGKQMVINPLLDALGVQMRNGTLVQRSSDYSYSLVMPNLTTSALTMEPALSALYKDKTVVAMSGAAALSYENNSGFEVRPLLMTDAKISWIKQGKFVLDSAALQFEPKNGDLQDSFPTALMLTRKINNKEQRIMVSGDADFFSNKEMGRVNLQTANGAFAMGIFKWFTYGEFPVDMSRPEFRDNTLKLNRAGVHILEIIYYGIIPGVIILLGMVLLIRRKRK